MQEDSIHVLSLGVENHPSQSVPAAENVPYITNTSSNPTHINGELLFHCNELYLYIYIPVVTAVVVVAVGFLLCISVPMLVIFMQRVRKQKSKLIYCRTVCVF